MSRRAADTSEGGPALRQLRTIPGFSRYWVSIGLGGLASSIGGITVSLIAVTTLHANPLEMALLNAAGFVPSVLLQVSAGAWSDRHPLKSVSTLVAADSVSVLITAVIPAMWLINALTFPVLLISDLMLALVGVMRLASQTPVLTSLVSARSLVDANGKLASTRSAADIIGQGAAGALLAVLLQPIVLIVNAVLYLASAILLTRLPRNAGSAESDSAPTVNQEERTSAVLRRILSQPIVWTYALIGSSGAIVETVFVIYVTRVLHLSAHLVPWAVGAGAIGGVLGGAVVGRLESRVGARWSVILGCATTVGSTYCLLLGRPGYSAFFVAAAYECLAAFGGTLILATTYGHFLSQTHHSAVARTSAVLTNVGQVAGLTGLAAGALVGTRLSPAAAIYSAVVAATIGGLTAAASRRVR